VTQFEHSQRIESLIEAGNLIDAIEVHNIHVKGQFAKARAGEVIDLTDLMAAKELLQQAT
jgi:hypothetical protein